MWAEHIVAYSLIMVFLKWRELLCFVFKIAKVCPNWRNPHYVYTNGAAFSSSSLSHGHKRHRTFFIPPPFFPPFFSREKLPPLLSRKKREKKRKEKCRATKNETFFFWVEEGNWTSLSQFLNQVWHYNKTITSAYMCPEREKKGGRNTTVIFPYNCTMLFLDVGIPWEHVRRGFRFDTKNVEIK